MRYIIVLLAFLIVMAIYETLLTNPCSVWAIRPELCNSDSHTDIK